MIAPLIPYAIRGVISYQGESNSSRAKEYHQLFSGLIADWRAHWGLGDFPFLFVQIAPHNQMAPELRKNSNVHLADDSEYCDGCHYGRG